MFLQYKYLQYDLRCNCPLLNRGSLLMICRILSLRDKPYNAWKSRNQTWVWLYISTVCSFIIKPLFKGYMTLLIFKLTKEIASNGILCIQRFKGDERDKTALQYNSNNIDVHDSNPFEADSRSFVAEKIIVKNLPFNTSNKQVFEELRHRIDPRKNNRKIIFLGKYPLS